MNEKYVYLFVPDQAEGDASMRSLLGGKGALLAELVRIGLPVPAGFTLTTEACLRYQKEGDAFLETLRPEVDRVRGRTRHTNCGIAIHDGMAARACFKPWPT